MNNISKATKEDLKKLVERNTSFSGVLRELGVTCTGGSNHEMLKSKLDKLEINYTHIPRGPGHNKGRSFVAKESPLSLVMTINSTYKNIPYLKKRIIKEKIMEDKCCSCGIGPEWNNKKLTLQLDHKNGIKTDNRLENLQILCPNCHTQTHNYGSKNIKHRNVG